MPLGAHGVAPARGQKCADMSLELDPFGEPREHNAQRSPAECPQLGCVHDLEQLVGRFLATHGSPPASQCPSAELPVKIVRACASGGRRCSTCPEVLDLE